MITAQCCVVSFTAADEVAHLYAEHLCPARGSSMRRIKRQFAIVFPVGSHVRTFVFPSCCFIETPAVIADKQKLVMSNCLVVLGARRINYCASPAIISLVDLNTGSP